MQRVRARVVRLKQVREAILAAAGNAFALWPVMVEA